MLDQAYKESRRHLKVADIMSRKVITTTPETTMIHAAKTKGEKHIGDPRAEVFRIRQQIPALQAEVRSVNVRTYYHTP